uniref:Dirigent protein n=1 Tax=Caenorhabditis tropicalis TaxID=1561998 RepID=A0A1I7TKX4_9PELO
MDKIDQFSTFVRAHSNCRRLHPFQFADLLPPPFYTNILNDFAITPGVVGVTILSKTDGHVRNSIGQHQMNLENGQKTRGFLFSDQKFGRGKTLEYGPHVFSISICKGRIFSNAFMNMGITSFSTSHSIVVILYNFIYVDFNSIGLVDALRNEENHFYG